MRFFKKLLGSFIFSPEEANDIADSLRVANQEIERVKNLNTELNELNKSLNADNKELREDIKKLSTKLRKKNGKT